MRISIWIAATIATVFGGTARADDDDDFKEFKPEPGFEVARPMKPDWCAGYTPKSNGCDANCQDRKVRSTIDGWQQTNEGDLPRLAQLACDFPDNSKVQKQVASLRQSWINRTGLGERDDREGLKLYVNLGERGAIADAVKQVCDKLQPAKPEGAVEWRQWSTVHQALCTGDPLARQSLRPDRELVDMMWMERPDKPVSAIGRAFFVIHGLPVYSPTRDDFSMMTGDAASRFPLVNVSITRMDRRALDAEISALGLTGVVKQRALVLAGGASVVARTWAATIKNDAEVTKYAAAAETAFTAWTKTYEANKPAFDLAYAVEDKVMAVPINDRSNPHPIGCEELRKTLKDHIIAQKPKTKEDVKAAAADVVSYTLLSRLILCDAAEGRWGDAAAEQQLLAAGRFSAGPFTAAMWATVDAGAKKDGKPLTDDVTRYATRILDDHVRRTSTLNERYDGTGGISMQDYRRQGHLIEMGRVDSVKKAGDGIEIAFKTEKWLEPDYKCTNTGRVIQWAPNGQPQYDWHCVVSGSHTEEFQLQTRVFTDRSAADVKVGQIIKVVTSEVSGAKTPPSFVLEVDAPAKGKAPPAATSFFGIKLK